MRSKSQLSKILATIPSLSIKGYFYRSVDYYSLHSNNPPNALYALGPGKHGQRYTPQGGSPALYVSDKTHTSFSEATHLITSSVQKITLTPPEPIVIFAIFVHLEHVLDLTDKHVLDKLGTSVRELQGAWAEQKIGGVDVPTHIIAEAAYKLQRFQGIKYKSKEHTGGINLVIWPDKVKAPSFVEVYDPSKTLAARIPSSYSEL